MAEQDDVLHLIDDTGTVPEDSSARKWKIAVIDDDAAVHEGTRFALSDYSLHGATLEILSAYSAAEGRTLMRDTSRHRGRAARRHHGDRRRRPRSRRVHPQRAQERDRPHHPAHRPAGPGARAPRHRPVRHQRLQGQDRADGRQAVHLADGGAAQLPAARAHGADPARARNHHRRRLDAVRLQIDAAAGRRRADPARLTAQCRLRRHPGAARRRRRGRRILGAGGLGLLQPLHRHRPVPSRSIRICAQMVEAAFQRRKNEFADHRSVLYLRTGSGREVVVLLQAERQLSDTDRVAGRDFLQPAVDRVRQRHPLPATARGQYPARGPRRPAHPRADAGQPPAVGAVAAAAARQRLQERDSRHRRARPEESARRDPRPHRNADRADRRRLARRRTSPPRSSTSATPPSA